MEKKRSKKAIFLIAILTMIFVANAWGSGSSESGKKADEGAGDKITLKVLDGYGGMVEKMMALYEELNPDITIDYEYVPSNNYYAKFTALNVSGQLPDVIWTNGSFLVEQVQSGVLLNLTDELMNGQCYEGDAKWIDTLNPALIENARAAVRPLGAAVADKSYALPFTLTSVAVIYDKAVFDKLGLKEPKTWNEFNTNNEVLKSAGYIPISMQGQNMDWWPRILWDQFCRDKLDADPNAFEEGKMDFSDSTVKAGLSTIKDMWDKGYFPESALTANRDAMLQLFVQKNMAQLLIQGQYLEYLTNNAPAGMKLASYALPGVAGKPTRSLGGASEQWGVPVKSTHHEEAVRLIKFLTSRTSFAEDYARFVTPCLKENASKEKNDLNKGYMAAAANGFIPEIYVPVNATTELSNDFKTDLMPNYLLGIYSLDQITAKMDQLYKETYLDVMKK
ncbi:extracellular solute-binding protein [Marispirochaeta sp.]|uniref:ABC transporter substrate-binding protein n=1 Tax=Marispirochaeta sp. TaxID=2038653 RepID=UPI0029C90147|nr:extracellular solute-binding protein [Marispirochaeta sp.]